MIEIEGDVSDSNLMAIEVAIFKGLSKIIDTDCVSEFRQNSTIVDVISYPRDKLSNSGELFWGTRVHVHVL